MFSTTKVRVAFLLAFVAAFAAACQNDDRVGPITVIGSVGGTVHGPKGSVLVIPPGAIEEGEEYSFSIGLVDKSRMSDILPAQICGDAFLVSPSGVRFEKPATILIPDVTCDMSAVMVLPAGTQFWSVLSSGSENGFRAAELPHGGIVGVGSLTVTSVSDTTVFVGSSIVPSVKDARGQNVNHAWVWMQSLNLDVIGPDNEYAGGQQRAKAEGVGGLRVTIPAAGFEDTIEVRVLPNPARSVRIIRGDNQSVNAGAVLPDSLVAEVRAAEDKPAAGVWVDFYVETDGGRSMVGSLPTNALGRAAILARFPSELAGQRKVVARVAGTDLSTTADINVVDRTSNR